MSVEEKKLEIHVVTPDEFIKMWRTLLDNMYDNGFINSFLVQANERRIIVEFKDNFTMQDAKKFVADIDDLADFLSTVFFMHSNKELKKDALGLDDDIILQFPPYSIKMIGDGGNRVEILF